MCFPVGGVGGLEVVGGPPPSEEQSDWLTVSFPRVWDFRLVESLRVVSFEAFSAHCVGELLRSRIFAPASCVVLALFWPRSLCTVRSLWLPSGWVLEVARYKTIVEPLLNQRRWFARLGHVSSACRCELHDLADATSGVAMARVGFPEESLTHQLAELEVSVVRVYSEVRQDLRTDVPFPTNYLTAARFGWMLQPDAPSQWHTTTRQRAASTRLV